jgi:hypothetical protein
VANTTDVAVTWDTELFDVGGMHSTSSNTSRFTVPTGGDGLYLITTVVVFAANGTGLRRAQIRKNGAELVGLSGNTVMHGVTAAGDVGVPLTAIADLAAGDYLEVYAWQSSGGALNINSGAAGSRDLSQAQIVKLW